MFATKTHLRSLSVPLVLAGAVVALAACEAEPVVPPATEAAITEAASMDVADSVGAPASPSADAEALWQSFIRVERGGEEGAPVSIERMQQLCETANTNGMNMISLIGAEGLPQSWLNNYGQIEAASWSVAPNTYGIQTITFWYSRAGVIRNVSYFGDGNSHRGGISDWMSGPQLCRPGVTFDG